MQNSWKIAFLITTCQWIKKFFFVSEWRFGYVQKWQKWRLIWAIRRKNLVCNFISQNATSLTFQNFLKKLLDICLPNMMFWAFNLCPFCPWEGRKVLIVGLSDFVCFFSKVFLKGIPLCRTLFLSFYSSDKTFYHVVFQNFSKRQTAGPDFRFKSSLFLLKIHVHGFLFSFSIFRKIFWFCCCLFTK